MESLPDPSIEVEWTNDVEVFCDIISEERLTKSLTFVKFCISHFEKNDKGHALDAICQSYEKWWGNP